MVKLCQEHMDAICHAELFLESATEKVQSRKVLAALEKDKLKLAELKLYILISMCKAPKLPFLDEGNNHPPSTRPGKDGVETGESKSSS